MHKDKIGKLTGQLLQDIKILDPKVDPEKIKSNIILGCNIEEICKDSILIQESIIEDLEAKKQIFKELDKLSSKQTILASSSSYLLISKISELVEHRNRCINAHPALPPHVVPFVEVVGSDHTSKEIVKSAINIYKNGLKIEF